MRARPARLDPSSVPRPRTLGTIVPLVAAAMLGLGVLLWVALVVELAIPMADSLHHDFLAFYSAGRLVLTGRPNDLYDATALMTVQRAIVPGPVGVNGYMPFINPPFAAVAFAPLAALTPEVARAAWALLNVALLVVAAIGLVRPLTGRDRVLAILLLAAAFPVYHALAEGQWSILLLAAGVGAFAAARDGRWTLAGLALVPFWLKPQLLILPILALLIARRWRALLAVAAGGAVLVIVSLPFTGTDPYGQYLGYLADVVTSHFVGAGAVGATTWQGDLATTEGLNGLLVGYLGQAAVELVDVLWALGVAALVGLYGLAARRQLPGFDSLPGRAMLAAGIGLTLLVNPNLFAQDCVLLLLVLVALRPLPARLMLPSLVAVVACADLILLDQGPITVHAFTIVLLAAVAVVCWRVLARPRPASVRVPSGSSVVRTVSARMTAEVPLDAVPDRAPHR